jgi:hypothetical protein
MNERNHQTEVNRRNRWTAILNWNLCQSMYPTDCSDWVSHLFLRRWQAIDWFIRSKPNPFIDIQTQCMTVNCKTDWHPFGDLCYCVRMYALTCLFVFTNKEFFFLSFLKDESKALSTKREVLFISSVSNTTRDMKQIYTYIPLTLYPRRGSRAISDLLPDAHVLPKVLSYEEYYRPDIW